MMLLVSTLISKFCLFRVACGIEEPQFKSKDASVTNLSQAGGSKKV